MSLITPDSGLIIWMTLIFAIVFLVLAKFGFPIITKSVSKRNERITDSLRLADEAEKRLTALARQQEEMMQDARAEHAKLLKDASKAGDEIIAQAKAQAKQEAAQIISKAREQIESEREDVLKDIRRQVAVISCDVAEKIVRQKLESSDAQASLIDRMVEEASKSDNS